MIPGKFKKTPQSVALFGWLLLFCLYGGVLLFSRLGFEITPVALVLSPLGILALASWVYGFAKGVINFKIDRTKSDVIIVTLISVPPILGSIFLLWLMIDGF